MLRALTSYFFGGIQDETPEAPIECETREVNDWLVVNLPDQNKDNINLNEDDDTYEIDDGDIRNDINDEDDVVEVDASDVDEMDEEENEDDILMSLSFLMTPPVECTSLCADLILEQYPTSQSYYDVPSPTKWDNRKEIIGSNYLRDLVLFDPHPQMLRRCERYQQENEETYEVQVRRIEKRGHRNDIVNEYERVNAQAIELAPPPTYSKSYVNHRHPEKLLSHGSDNEEQSERIKKQNLDDKRMTKLFMDAVRNSILMQEELSLYLRNKLVFFTEGTSMSRYLNDKMRAARAEQERRYHEDEDYRKRLISHAIATCPLKESQLSRIGERERKHVFENAPTRRIDLTDKTNILQRIKQLEPEQQAAQRSIKKILTRGQLNRQNKNYMYETSSKKNRRSKLQRNHSGANNNRKC